MLWVLIVGLVTGGLVTNGLPYFVKGAMGQKHPTPLGNSAAQNVIWGWLNLVVAVLIWHLAEMRHHPRVTFLGVAIGSLVVGLWLADTWARHSEK